MLLGTGEMRLISRKGQEIHQHMQEMNCYIAGSEFVTFVAGSDGYDV
jgi:hypothetical protein